METDQTKSIAGTRGRILELLWRGRQTVDELAGELSLTDNAVRAHLVSLERDGLVRQSGQRRGLRKPSLLYTCTSEAERLLPKPYSTVLSATLSELTAELGPEAVAETMRRVGERLAEAYRGRFAGLEPSARVRELAGLLRELGGLADVEAREGGYRIVGHSCPLRAVVAQHPAGCLAMQAFIQSIVSDGTVRECCEHDGTVHCHFELDL